MEKDYLERIRRELLAQSIDIGSSKVEDRDFTRRFILFWQDLIVDMLKSEGSFFANFIVELHREIDNELIEPLATKPMDNFFMLLLNPCLVLECDIREIQALIKHEVYHILSLHHIRAKSLMRQYSMLAVNLAMDISVNQHIINLPTWSETIESVQKSFNLTLPENLPLENYTVLIQEALNKKKRGPSGIDGDISNLSLEENSLPFTKIEKYHQNWLGQNLNQEESKQLEAINRILEGTAKHGRPESVNLLIENLSHKSELTWQKLLHRTLGSTAWNKKRTITRKDRRMPDRLDLRGKITHYICDVIIAVDTSGSMTEVEINAILIEVRSIIRNYNSRVVVIECDDEIRNIYELSKSTRFIHKPTTNGRTKYSPVFEFICRNEMKDAMLIYFTDGAGESSISGNIFHKNTIWVITSEGGRLSLDKPPGIILTLKNKKPDDEKGLPLEFLKSEMKEIRSEWAK